MLYDVSLCAELGTAFDNRNAGSYFVPPLVSFVSISPGLSLVVRRALAPRGTAALNQLMRPTRWLSGCRRRLLIRHLLVRSNLTREKQCDEDDQNNADDADATVAESVTVAAEAATEATEQEDNEDDNEDGSERHGLSPMAGLN